MAINPATLSQTLPQNDYHLSGGLGGYVSGMQIADYLDNMGRGRRSDDLEYATKQNELENAQLDNPLKQAVRQLSMSKTGAEQNLFNDGTAQEAMRAKVNNEIETAYAARGARGVKELQDQGDFFHQADIAIKSGNMTPEIWQDHVKKGAAIGLKLPPVLDPDTVEKIGKYAKVGLLTRQQAAARQTQAEHESFTATQNELNRKSALEIARTRVAAGMNKGSADNAFIRAVDDAEEIADSDVSRYITAIQNKNKTLLSVLEVQAQSSARSQFAAQTPEWRKAHGNDPSKWAKEEAQKEVTNHVIDDTLRSLQGKRVKMADGSTQVITEASRPLIEKLYTGISSNATSTQGKASTSTPAATRNTAKAEGPGSGTPPAVKADVDPVSHPAIVTAFQRLGLDPKKPEDLQRVRDNFDKSNGDKTVKATILKILDDALARQKGTTPAQTPGRSVTGVIRQ